MVTKDQRRRQLAREKFERQQQRRSQARSKARRRNAVVAAVAVAVVAVGAATWALGGLTGGGDTTETVDSAASASATSAAPDPCEKAAPGSPATKTWKKEPEVTIDKKAKYTFTLETTCGDIGLSLDAAKTPRTVNSFAFLAGEGYFDHTRCHRLTTAGIYVLQCGDPAGDGTGGPGYTIPDENLKDESIAGGTYPAGTVAMANTGQPGTGGSQFFLVYKDSPLPATYTPFGTVSDAGMEVLEEIAAAGEATGAGDGTPNATVVIDKATVTKS